MAMFDIIMENSFVHEGVLSSANMKSQLTTLLLKIYNGKADMADGKSIGQALKKVRGVKQSQYLFTIKGDMYDVTYYQHRYLVEDKKGILYQVDIWNKPMELISRTTVKKMYDPSSTNIPEKICKDFMSGYISMAKKAFLGYASISKNTMGIYMYTPEPGKQDSQLQGVSYGDNAPAILSLMNNMAKKYPDDLKQKSNNELSYIG